MKLDLNPQFAQALQLMEETSKNVFITGRAGTGKSTLLTHFRSNTKKQVAVLAPTGVAAVNIRGQTIHSFFGFKPDITLSSVGKIQKNGKKNIYKKLDAIVIDEISMVRADLLDCVDRFLRLNGPSSKHPFGGVQMIFIGDLYQLPPVLRSTEKSAFQRHYKTPYFFSAQVFQNLEMEFLELEKIYRQTDETFIRLLNTIRNRTAGESELADLNQRVDAHFDPPLHDFYITLTSTNDRADDINRAKLETLSGKRWTFEASMEGKFEKQYLPTDEELFLKVGAQIMLLNNDSAGRWVNGTVGKILSISQDEWGDPVIEIQIQDGKKVYVAKHTWEIFRFFINGHGALDSDVIGSFTQYPIRLAFAVTIHKSQGKTFDKVIIDIGKGTFAHGQMYVALSRSTSLEGLILRQPIQLRHILLDWAVPQFLTRYQYQRASDHLSKEQRQTLLENAIRDDHPVTITYLKAKDEKSRRTVKPLRISEMEYAGHTFWGLEAYCMLRNDNRVFNIDRILEIEGV